MSAYTNFVVYFGGGGHQSVRDRTTQAGAPIFKIHWHLYKVYELEVRIGLMGLTGQWHTEMP